MKKRGAEVPGIVTNTLGVRLVQIAVYAPNVGVQI
jgi:hypothetical protein